MKILSDEQMNVLIENGKKIKEGNKQDIPSVVYLRFYNNPPSAWMLAAVEPDNHDLAFGLMQITDGTPELGYVSLKELEEIGVKHDPMFETADKLSIYRYAQMAKDYGEITLRITQKVTKDDLKHFSK